MVPTDYIAVKTICQSHSIEDSFLYSLSEVELIEIIVQNETPLINLDQLSAVEKYIRMHKDLSLNSEGIEIISRLTEKMVQLQNKIEMLQRRLDIFEQEYPMY